MLFLLWFGIVKPQPITFSAELQKKNSSTDIGFAPAKDGFVLLEQPEFSACWLTKFDECFNIIWSKKQQINLNSSLNSTLSPSADEDYFFLINIYQRNNYGSTLIVSKLSSNTGGVVWSKHLVFSSAGEENFINAVYTTASADSGVIIASQHGKSSNAYGLLDVHKLDKNGNLIFTRTFSTPAGLHFRINSIHVVANGNVLLFIHSPYVSPLDYNLYMFGISPSGTPILFQKISSTTNQWSYRGSTQMSDGSIVVLAQEHQYKKLFYFTVQNMNTISGIKGYITIGTGHSNGGVANGHNLMASEDSAIVFVSYRDSATIIKNADVVKFNYFSDSFWNKTIKKEHIFSSVFNWNRSILLLGMGANKKTILMKIPETGELDCNETDRPRDTSGIPVAFDSIPKPLPFPILTGEFIIRDTTIAFEEAIQKIDILCSDIKIPRVELGNDTLICLGSAFAITAGEPADSFSYHWSTGDTLPSITVGSSGKYWVQVFNGGCMATDTIDLVFLHEAQSVLPEDTSICPYDSLRISIPANGNYRFIKPRNDTINQGDFYVKDSGTYYLISELSGNCIFKDSVALNLHELPAASAGPDTLLCYNQEYMMQGAGGITYHWIPAKYLSSDTIPNPIAKLPQQQNYILIVGNTTGCRDTSVVALEVRPPLNLRLTASDAFICKNDTVQFTTTATGGDSNAYSFSWNGNVSSGSNFYKTFESPDWVYVKLEDGCSPSVMDSTFINVAQPTASFAIQPDDTTQVYELVHLINYSTDATYYSWDIGNGENSNAYSPHVTYKEIGHYQIQLTAFSERGCVDTISQWVWVFPELKIFIPNAFHPGGRINEIFQPTSSATISYHLIIFDRWGQKIWEGTDTGWNGHYRGKAAPEGVYLYKMELLNSSIRDNYFHGNVNLLR